MDYLKCEVEKEKKWLEDPVLIVTVHFSPEMIEVIDKDFLYEQPLLTIKHGTWLVRHWLKQPGVQPAPATKRFIYNKGTTATRIEQWTDDYGEAREQLQIFRWRLIKISRGIPDRPALSHSPGLPVVQEILEPVRTYNGNFGAKGY